MVVSQKGLAGRLSEAKASSGKTWEEIAEAAGGSKEHWQRLASKGDAAQHNEPSVFKIARFAEITGASMDWLLGIQGASDIDSEDGDIMAAVATRIRGAMQRAEQKEPDLEGRASRAGISPARLRALSMAERLFPLATIVKFARLVGMPVGQLLEGRNLRPKEVDVPSSRGAQAVLSAYQEMGEPLADALLSVLVAVPESDGIRSGLLALGEMAKERGIPARGAAPGAPVSKKGADVRRGRGKV